MSTSKSKTSAYHHGDLREALIAAALAIFEEGGDPAVLSLRETARRAGVSAMAPYRHFADKDALLAGVAAVGFERLGAALREADKAEPAYEGLVAQGVAYVRFACDNPALFRLMFGAALGARHGDLLASSDSAFSVMARRVGAMRGADTADDWALCCWATAHGIASLAVDGQLAYTGEAPIVLANRVLRLLGPRSGN